MSGITLAEFKKQMKMPGVQSVVRYLPQWITEGLKDDFDFTYCSKGRYWYSEWEDHRRMAVKLWTGQPGTYPLWWGYNHDFIPELKNGKIVYHRTDKSVNLDLMDDYSSHLERPDRTGDLKYMYELPETAHDVAFAKEWVIQTVKRNARFMKEWFDTVKTVDDEIDYIDELLAAMDDSDVYGLGYTKAFLLAFAGHKDEAISTMTAYYSRYPVPPKILEKLKQM